ncbi:DUF4432 family protein [Sinomonas susongensis]|uniref:DUF4432 family protein n=1 Tax=Sinomonas susongensis TaxID=1324851 RepID=UPI001109008F|nr:DUF4432 family protein [Sinomonas susongensis]
MRIGGESFSREEVEALVGDIRQVASAVPVSFEEGRARGMRAVLLRVAGGICAEVLPDRGMDLGWASSGGVPLAWAAPQGHAAPAFAEHGGNGWARTFGGGLMATCGMMTIGAPSEDDGEQLGMHGRVASIPAERVACRLEWDGDELDAVVEGRVVEAGPGGRVLERVRAVRARVGEQVLEVRDTVSNIGAVPAPHMYRFHFNLGFPLVRPGDTIGFDGALLGHRPGAGPRGDWGTLASPVPDAAEEVLYLGPGGPEGRVCVLRPGPGGGKVLELEWDASAMPVLVVWKHQRSRRNVLGLEPSTAGDEGRARARETGELLTLDPGQSREYTARIRCHRP